MKIDAEKAIPKYLQLKEIIKHHLEHERYTADQKIPSENELMTQFAVSRSTVRQALAELVNEGVLYKEQGRGSFFSGRTGDNLPQSYLIGVITPLIAFYIYPQIIQGIDDVAHDKRYNIVLGSSDVNPDKELRCIHQLLEKKIDGLLIEPSGGLQDFTHSQNFQVLKNLDIPVVFMDWMLEDSGVSYVAPDDVEGGFRAVSYLANAGHRRIACVYPRDTLPAINRYQGYRKAIEAHGIVYDPRLDKSMTITQWNQPGHLVQLMRELLELGDDRATAAFFFNDDGALRGCEAMRQLGFRIPEDLSIIGFDDSELAARAEVPLTTMLHPKYQLGRWAADILFEQIEHQGQAPHRQMILNPTIVERGSVKRLA
jgi:GntR family transcriptional regulator, arabinose operon transcriptional repressor